MRKKVAFFVDRRLGSALALWAIKNSNRHRTRILILCKKENQGFFANRKAKIVHDEEEAFAFNPDIVFSINYWKIIDVKRVQKVRIINLHHSHNLLYRGRHTCTWAIINARKYNNWVHGTTLHLIDEKLDCGQIICSYSCPILEYDTAYSLFLRVEKLARKMFKDNYLKMINNDYSSSALPSGRFYYREKDLDHFIDFELPEVEICDRVRALTFKGKQLPYAVINNQKIELIWKGMVEGRT